MFHTLPKVITNQGGECKKVITGKEMVVDNEAKNQNLRVKNLNKLKQQTDLLLCWVSIKGKCVAINLALRCVCVYTNV